jgi:phage-related protein
MSWEIEYYNEKVLKNILSMPDDMVARFNNYAELMEQHGPALGMPHSKAMGKSLFELRVKGESGISRIFYCTIKGERVIILHSFIKKTQKTPIKEIDTARKRQKEVSNV